MKKTILIQRSNKDHWQHTKPVSSGRELCKFTLVWRWLAAASQFVLIGILFLSLTAVSSVAIAASVTVFSANFDGGVPPEFSGVTTTEGVQGYAGLGTGLN